MIKQLLYLLSPKARLQALGLLAMMTVGALVEVIGIGFVVPLVALAASPEAALSQPYLRKVYEFSGASSTQQFLMIVLGAFLALIVLKNLYLGFVAWVQYRLLFRQHAQVSQRLFDGYMSSSYALHLRRHSSDVSRNFLYEVDAVFSGIVTPLLHGVSETIVLALLVSTIFIAMPGKTLAVIVAGGAIVILLLLGLRVWLDRFGKQRATLSGQRIRTIGDALDGLKEARVLGRINYFRETFFTTNNAYLNAMRVLATLSALPRLVIEALAMALLVGAFFVMASMSTDLAATLPAFAMFCVAAVRLMPATTRIVGTINTSRFHRPALRQLYHDLKEMEKLPIQRPRSAIQEENGVNLTECIELQNLRYTYPGTSLPAIENVSAKIPAGIVCGFVGASGAGKSTLADLILGLFEPQAGSIKVDGMAITDRMEDWRRIIGYVPQSIHLLDDTIRNNVAYALDRELIEDDRVWGALADAQIDVMVRGLPDGLDTKIGEGGSRISGGQRQRLGIARALYHNPSLVILDEATSALDVRTERVVSETLLSMRRKRTIIVIAHRVDTIRRCDMLLHLDRGRLVASGTFDTLIAQHDDFAALIGAATL